jgi:hypothetical protein
MRIKAAMAMTLTMTGAAMTGALAASVPAAGKVLVCVDSGSYELNPVSMVVLTRAEGISSKMFKSAGVAVEWHSTGMGACRKPQRTPAIMLDFAADTPASQYPGALAYALPYEGVHIVVLFDRIEKDAAGPIQVSPLLAHVLTHEITHILQGIARHSETGVMKARWDSHDFLQMTRAPLPFTPEDIALIQTGLRSLAAGTPSTAPSASVAEVH